MTSQDYGIIGESPQIRDVRNQITHLLKAPDRLWKTVLINGETGTGKELVAAALHNHGPRKDNPFVAVNCAAVPEQLAEAQFFGYERGSYTGATARGVGYFQSADRGTLFLDEIADLPPTIQSKLLRVLQEEEVLRVGATRPETIDVRVISASSDSLYAATQEGRFRRDLLNRPNTVEIRVPPLRERDGDIERLARHFVTYWNTELGQEYTITSDALTALQRYDWPGNVRELQHTIQRSMAYLGEDRVITKDTLKIAREDDISPPTIPIALPPLTHRPMNTVELDLAQPLSVNLERAERLYLAELLRLNGGRMEPAATAAGVSRRTMLRRRKALGLTGPADASEE